MVSDECLLSGLCRNIACAVLTVCLALLSVLFFQKPVVLSVVLSYSIAVDVLFCEIFVFLPECTCVFGRSLGVFCHSLSCFSVVSCCFVFALVFFRWSLDPGHSSSASPEYHLSDLISEQPVWGPWTTTTSVLPVRKLVF